MAKKNEEGDVGKNCIVPHDIVDILRGPYGLRNRFFFIAFALEFYYSGRRF